ncbi:hypothetical protein LPUS_08827 [Lasallia pustulata]|uniref:DUF6594 domain-containing protein n=1 Tax=Lasallia pustulata TaxID=136370 RepID=A0A1W5D5Z2_9LECA|nr:hypothetical protein LPUS_08827 [Lasallia pustulata]
MSSLSPVSSDLPSMGSYNKLSKFMGSWPEVAIFRRFGALNAQNLLFLQAELVRLEDQLQSIREDDAQSADLEKKQSHQSWRSLVLAHEQGDASTSQWQKVLEIRDKLKEYNAALLEYRELCKLQTPNQRSLEALREWLARPRCGDYFLRGIEADVWDAGEAEQAADLVSLSEVHVNRDVFSKFLAFYIVPLYHRYFHRRVKKPDDPESGLYSYKESTLMTVTHIVGITLGTLIPTAAIFVLYYVHDMVARLGAILAFSALFSLALAVFTKAKKVEIFAATAAFASVQVVFVGSTNALAG